MTKKIVIEVPDDVADMADLFERFAVEMSKATPATHGGRAVDYGKFEKAVEDSVGGLEREVHRRLLQRLDIDQPRVFIEGKVFARVGRYEASYQTKAGAVSVARSIYREVGLRNAKVVDPVSLRAGVVEDGWLPATARAMGHLIQQGTSREAEATARELGRLPYSRSSFERVGHAVGALVTGARLDIEDALIEELEVPTTAESISVSLDRVSVPMEEPRPKPPGRPRKNAPKRWIVRNYRMAWCGTVTFHDENGEALHTIRYGRMPNANPTEVVDAMSADVEHVLAKRPDLKVSLLCDGAPDLWAALDAQLNGAALGVAPHRLVDLWHLLEKLGRAAVVIHGSSSAEAVLKRWRMRLLNSSIAASTILAELKGSGRENVRVGETRPVHDAITYILNHVDLMDYASARKAGLPLGSGNVEATCKSLFELRLKRPGARWHEQTGEHVVQLRALALSDRWSRGVTLALAPLRAAVRPAA